MADTLHRKMPAPGNLREKLSGWDAKDNPKAPLGDTQKDSFMELTTHSGNRPISVELPLDDFPTLAPHLSNVVSDDADDAIAKQLTNLKLDRIHNAQQFFAWYSEVEEQIEDEESQPQRAFIGQLQDYKSDCDKVIDEVTTALDHLTELKGRYVHVSTKTNALHEACENLLEEQTRLVNTAEGINNKLAYFNELERISSKLGSPTLTVTSESFIPMLSRMDECIAYLHKHPQYKESTTYQAKFRHCLSRALNLIKHHVFNILQNATQQVLPKKPDKVYDIKSDAKDAVPTPTDDAFTLFYGKFRANAPRVKSLVEQVEIRLDKSPEYDQLLTDCHQCYFQQRQVLLGPSVGNAVTELASKHARDHCALVRSGCAFMVHVCEDESQLFYHFYTKPTSALDYMLESLCTTLYDAIRPLIIHVNHLETLAELCSILKVEMLEEHVQNNPEQLAAFGAVCSQMLEDVQERFVYRTHIYIRQEILNYMPADGDLAYPDKLVMMENIAASIKKDKLTRKASNSSIQSATSLEVEQINASANQNVESGDAPGETTASATSESVMEGSFVSVSLTDAGGGNMPMSPADLHGMWYPTVRRTLVCLSKLYRCIDRSTFQGLSQETLSMCIDSLLRANDAIRKKKTQLDAELFLIKHLLILREQIAPFHVDFAVREMALDFSKLKDAAFELVKAKHRLFTMNSTNAILQFLIEGTPAMTEHFVDSKKEVDNQLKRTCEEFILLISTQFVGPLRDFLDKATVIIQMGTDASAPRVSLRAQPFAGPEKLRDTVALTYRNLKQHKASVQRAMGLYLSNKDTEYILFKPIKANVQQAFQQLHQILGEHYSTEDQQIIGAPSLEQINLLLASAPTAAK